MIPESVGSPLDFVEQGEAELEFVGVMPVQFVLRYQRMGFAMLQVFGGEPTSFPTSWPC